ncbi:MAG: glucose-1-phosphate thymidylyltransferase RfbA [Clostridia bacterium]|nr:glucose-1-phosphate thymidylyltransferase RfbA [Clostridia bacterium]
MKGIILAGGSGTRLYPITISTSKQLLPIYDKPMIYYPLSTLMIAGIKDILIISTPTDISRFEALFGDGHRLGINITYAVQEKPEGIAQAFLIGEKFIGNDEACLILGDNIFYGTGLKENLAQAVENSNKGRSTIFAYHVPDPERFGVVEFDNNNKVLSLEEKPKVPKSNYAATGLYFYDKNVVSKAKAVKPSARGELEITTLNNMYLDEGKLDVIKLDRGFTWLDTGTFESLAEASLFVKMVEEHQSLKISCLEEISYRNGWISLKELEEIGNQMAKNDYGKYLLRIVAEERN